MQFNSHFNVTSKLTIVTFTNFNISKVVAKEKLFQLFRYIGGNNPLYELEWCFPEHVSTTNIKEIIKNTCFVCGGMMADSTAYKNEDLYDQPDVLGRQKIYQQAGKAQLLKVRKCIQCGHSHT